jgi:hypothetical protein
VIGTAIIKPSSKKQLRSLKQHKLINDSDRGLL